MNAAADGGNERAKAYLAALDQHLRERGLSVASLALPDLEDHQEVSRGILRLSVRDNAPWEVAVSNTTPIDTPTELNGYVAARAASLARLTQREPARMIEVVVSPATELSLPGLGALLQCPCPTTQVIVDVYSPEGWLMSAFRNGEGADFADADSIEQSIREQIAVSLDLFPGLESEDVTFSVRSVRLTMTASAASAALQREEILLVDPIADLMDAYVGKAAVITVENPPDVREAHARLVLRQPVDADFVQPGEGR